MKPDFRALCIDLVNELHCYKVAHPQHDDDYLVTVILATFDWHRLSQAPIPVAERLPEADDMQNGRCWWFLPETMSDFPRWNFRDDARDRQDPPTHWMPHWAIPSPPQP